MILLRATRQTPKDWDELEDMISKVFREELYYPLLKIIQEPKDLLKNAIKSPLIAALESGRITFYRGTFSGKLNSEIVKELRKLGAKFDRRTGSYRIEKFDLPIAVRSAINVSDGLFSKKLELIDKQLSKILPEEVAKKLKVEKLFDRKIFKLEDDIRDTMKNITIAPQLSETARRNIAIEWQENMRLPIQTFTEEQVSKLRQSVQAAYFSGNRHESLIKMIQESYGVSFSKAKFLARNETTLLASKFKEARYRDSGIMEYKWQAVKGTSKHPTRKQHARLSEISDKGQSAENAVNGIFRWDNPPRSTEDGRAVRYNNPGCDYNCRCVARPVVRRK